MDRERNWHNEGSREKDKTCIRKKRLLDWRQRVRCKKRIKKYRIKKFFDPFLFWKSYFIIWRNRIRKQSMKKKSGRTQKRTSSVFPYTRPKQIEKPLKRAKKILLIHIVLLFIQDKTKWEMPQAHRSEPYKNKRIRLHQPSAYPSKLASY